MPQLKDKFFEPFISHAKIQNRIAEIAVQINQEYKEENPILIGVLNGAFRFVSDLSAKIEIPCEVSFVRLSSYQGMESSQKVKDVFGLPENLAGRKIILVEDIIDSGLTLKELLPKLEKAGAESVDICTLLYKPAAFQYNYDIKFKGFEIPNEFVVGYGLDYDEAGRCWNDICKLDSNPKNV